MRIKLKLLILSFIVASAAVLINAKPAFSATVLSINPQIVYKLPNETFKVNVTVSDVKFLYIWQANISFNPSVIEFVNVTEGEFLKTMPGGTMPMSKLTDAAAGWILIGWTSQGAYQGKSGTGTLATVEFRVLTEGESRIKINTEPIWVDKDQDGIVDPDEWVYTTRLRSQSSTVDIPSWSDIVFTAVDSFFFNLEVPPTPDFTYSPVTPGIDEAITFDASASSATPPRNIIEYYWDFGDGTNDTGQTIEHAFSSGGLYTVSLTVIDDAPATTLVNETYNTSTMPRVWYEVYSTKTEDIGIAFVHDIAVSSVVVSSDEVTEGETVSINVTVRNDGLVAESFNVTAYYSNNVIEKRAVIGMNNGTQQTLVFNWDTTNVPAGSYQISAEATDIEGDATPANDRYVDGIVQVLAAPEPFPITLVIGAAVAVAVVLIAGGFWFLRRRQSPTG